MGISGLLPMLKECSTFQSVAEYRGQKVGVDASSWLHKGAYGCASALCNGQQADSFVRYFMHHIDMMLHHNVTPVVVFDGAPLPMKKDTNLKRGKSRKNHIQAARGILADGGDKEDADAEFRQGVRVTWSMCNDVIQALKEAEVEFIVAPYEADAQLAFLIMSGQAKAVITEDGDLAAYGCTKIFTKMDRFGQGVEVDLTKLQTVKGFRSFKGDMFLEMCVLGGCDYVDSLPGIGIKTACALMGKHRDIFRVITKLRYDKKSEDKSSDWSKYEVQVRNALNVFKFHRVFDNQRQVCRSLREDEELPPDADKILGRHLNDGLARRLARGDMDPRKYEQLEQERAAKSRRRNEMAFASHKRDREQDELKAAKKVRANQGADEDMRAMLGDGDVLAPVARTGFGGTGGQRRAQPAPKKGNLLRYLAPRASASVGVAEPHPDRVEERRRRSCPDRPSGPFKSRAASPGQNSASSRPMHEGAPPPPPPPLRDADGQAHESFTAMAQAARQPLNRPLNGPPVQFKQTVKVYNNPFKERRAAARPLATGSPQTSMEAAAGRQAAGEPASPGLRGDAVSPASAPASPQAGPAAGSGRASRSKSAMDRALETCCGMGFTRDQGQRLQQQAGENATNVDWLVERLLIDAGAASPTPAVSEPAAAAVVRRSPRKPAAAAAVPALQKEASIKPASRPARVKGVRDRDRDRDGYNWVEGQGYVVPPAGLRERSDSRRPAKRAKTAGKPGKADGCQSIRSFFGS